MAMDHDAQGMAAAALQKSRVALQVLEEVLENLEHGKVLGDQKRRELLTKIKAAIGPAG